MSGSPEHRLVYSCLMHHSAVLEQMNICKSQGCGCDWDEDAGTLVITHDEQAIVRAVQKGAGDTPWMISFYNTKAITWEKPNGVRSDT